VNELAVNLAAERVDDGYLQFLVVSQAAVTDVLRKLLAVLDRFGVACELDADAVRIGTPSFISKKKGDAQGRRQVPQPIECVLMVDRSFRHSPTLR